MSVSSLKSPVLPDCTCAYPPTHLPTYLPPTYLPTYLLTYSPTHLLTYSPVYVSTYLPTYLSTHALAHYSQDPRLVECLVSVGRHFGGAHYVEKQIEALDAAGHVHICKAVYCGVTGKTEAELHAAFASKGWASQDVTRGANPAQGASLGRRRMM